MLRKIFGAKYRVTFSTVETREFNAFNYADLIKICVNEVNRETTIESIEILTDYGFKECKKIALLA